MVDARYRNKKNGRIAVIVQEDTKYKTVLVQYEDTEEEQQVSFSTLKRWWEELDEDDEGLNEVEEDEEDEEEYDDEEDEDEIDEDGDDEEEEADEDEVDDEEDEDIEDNDEDSEEDEAEVEEEKPVSKKSKKVPAKEKASKEKKDRKHRESVEPNPEVAELFSYIRDNAEKLGGELVGGRHGDTTGSMKVDGHRFLKYRCTKARVLLYFRPEVAEGVVKPVKITKYMFGAECVFDKADKETKDTLHKLIKIAVDEQKSKMKEKKTKKSKKED